MFDKKPGARSLAILITTLGGPAALAQQGDGNLVLEEVIVTATRRAESVQDVPMTVTAISAEQVQDFNLFRFEDIERLSPGLSLVNRGAIGSAAQLRGVGFDTNSSTDPSVDIYFNETPLDANFAFQSMYDIGQVEVLRGPQGTLRGRPSPAGAITLTTRRPSLEGFGGYLSGTAGDEGTYNAQGAVNMPLITDALALRVAAVYDEDEGDRVESVNSGEETRRKTESVRGSVLWAATDFLELSLTHQWLESDRTLLTEVEGPGMGYNGPAISGRSGKSVMEASTGGTQKSRMTNWGALWELENHRLIYNGAYQDNSYEFDSELDIYNAVIDFLELQNVPTDFEVKSHELRLESTAPDLFMDYLVGLWYYEYSVDSGFAQPQPLSGAFGNPESPSPLAPPDPDYLYLVSGGIPVDSEDKAVYGNVDMHLTEKTDLSIGARYLEIESDRTEVLQSNAALNAFPFDPAGCAGLAGIDVGTGIIQGVSPWPGYCNILVHPLDVNTPASAKDDEWVYGVAFKQYVTDELMLYARYDHSFRPPGTTVGLTSPVSDPSLIQGDAEESDSYEVGIRSDWLDGRLRANAAVFHQAFDNYAGRFGNPPPPMVGAGNQIIPSPGFSYPADAVVDGVEFDLTGQVSDNWWAQLAVAYSDGHYDDASVPCKDTNTDGTPDDGDIGNLTIGDFTGNDGSVNTVLFCEVDYALSTIPNWTGMLTSEYSFPLFAQEAYIRGLYNYYGEQDNLAGGFEADAYGVLNLYAGLRSQAGDWEVSLWAKNLLDEDEQLRKDSPQTVYGAFETGYHRVGYVAGREIGVTLRYLFGDG